MYSESKVIEDDYTQHFRQLDNLSELIAAAEEVASWSSEEQTKCSSINGDFEFTGTYSLYEAIDLCKHGWPDGRQRIRESIASLDAGDLANLGSKVLYNFETAGDEPDIDRYLAGEPDNMIEYYLDSAKKGKNLKLVVNASEHAFIPSEVLERRGVAIAATMETVAAAGFGIELELVEKSSSGRWKDMATVEYRIPVVKAGEYFDLDSMSFAIAHPSFLRRLIFALNETESTKLRNTMGYWDHMGYGYPVDPELDETGRDMNAILISKDDALLSSDEKVVPYVVKLANRLMEKALGEDDE